MCQKSHAKLAKRKARLSRNKTDANTMHTRTNTHTHTHKYMHTRTHTHTHACMHTHAHNRRRTHNRIALSFCAVNSHCPRPLYVKQLQDTAVAPGHCLQKMTQRPLQQNCWSTSKWFDYQQCAPDATHRPMQRSKHPTQRPLGRNVRQSLAFC